MTREEIRALAEQYAARYTDENGFLSVAEVCHGERIRLYSYRQAGRLLSKHGLEKHMEKCDAFTFANIIFFDDTQCIERQRFSIAHEIGHEVLWHSVKMVELNQAELEADAFAFNLLSPQLVERRA